jgi:hypothetical protein
LLHGNKVRTIRPKIQVLFHRVNIAGEYRGCPSAPRAFRHDRGAGRRSSLKCQLDQSAIADLVLAAK